MVVLMAAPCDAEAQRRNSAAQDASTSTPAEVEKYVLKVGNELVTLTISRMSSAKTTGQRIPSIGRIHGIGQFQVEGDGS